MNLVSNLLSTTCWVLCKGAYQEPPLDPEHLITSTTTHAEAQRRNKQIADSVLIKALKVILTIIDPSTPWFAGCRVVSDVFASVLAAS